MRCPYLQPRRGPYPETRRFERRPRSACPVSVGNASPPSYPIESTKKDPRPPINNVKQTLTNPASASKSASRCTLARHQFARRAPPQIDPLAPTRLSTAALSGKTLNLRCLQFLTRVRVRLEADSSYYTKMEPRFFVRDTDLSVTPLLTNDHSPIH